MKYFKLFKILSLLLLSALIYISCTKLNTPVYSDIENSKFWNTPEQVASGVAPAYSPLQGYVQWDKLCLAGVSDELDFVAKGTDWLDIFLQDFYTHNLTAENTQISGTWSDLFNGITKCNYELEVVNNLTTKPSNINGINAELKLLRAYYYLQALDIYGNVPIDSSFNVDPSTIKNNTRLEVFNFVESQLKANIPYADPTVDASTYGRATKWVGFATLAKLYLNAQVYTGTPRWSDCAAACDSIIMSGNFALAANYFDNFKPDNDYNVPSPPENIFVVPFDKNYIGGNYYEDYFIHYLSGTTLGTGGGWNGPGTDGDYYYGNFDTSSTYSASNGKVYRTFNDQRTGQYLTGQQFNIQMTYPPDKNIVVASDNPSDSIFDQDDQGNNVPLYLHPNFDTLAYPNSTPYSRSAGARSIKYFPEAGTSGDQSNDVPLFRLADILLMRAECIMRGAPAGSTGSALSLINEVRERAYSGDASHDWTSADLTMPNLLAERARELSWEGFRRQDLIRFDVADGTNYFGGARGGDGRAPYKPADPDTHYRILPIPVEQYQRNPNLVQNPGYPSF